MRYLLDTNVISEIGKPRPHPLVETWYEEREDEDLFLSVITVGEIRKGVELRRRSDRDRAELLDDLLEKLSTDYATRLLPIDKAIAEEWGRLAVINANHSIDRLLVATASVHGLTLVTRNIKHVNMYDIPIVNPFQ
jgi:predicted nucleic acid-binding protein